jgi:hypothetical protein
MDGERQPTRRELRQQKREIKRAGSQRRRRLLKQALREDPEETPSPAPDFGRLSSAPMNGMDRDPTRRRAPSSRDGG